MASVTASRSSSQSSSYVGPLAASSPATTIGGSHNHTHTNGNGMNGHFGQGVASPSQSPQSSQALSLPPLPSSGPPLMLSFSSSSSTATATATPTHHHNSLTAQAVVAGVHATTNEDIDDNAWLTTNIRADWRSQYVDFNRLKRQVKKIVEEDKAGRNTAVGERHASGLGNSHEMFWIVLKSEVDKVNTFFCDQEDECWRKLDALKLDCTGAVEIPSATDGGHASTYSSDHHGGDITTPVVPVNPRMRPGGDLRTVTEATFTRAFAEVNPKLAREVLFESQLHHAEQTTVNPSLLSHFKEFLRLCEQLDDLRKFVIANYVVVLKLLQKYDYLTHQKTRTDFINRLADEPFYSAKVLTNLLSRAESITDQLITRKNTLEGSMFCPLCRKSLDKPVRLPCSHRFCFTCLARTPDFETSCPSCGRPHNLDPTALQVESVLTRFVSISLENSPRTSPSSQVAAVTAAALPGGSHAASSMMSTTRTATSPNSGVISPGPLTFTSPLLSSSLSAAASSTLPLRGIPMMSHNSGGSTGHNDHNNTSGLSPTPSIPATPNYISLPLSNLVHAHAAAHAASTNANTLPVVFSPSSFGSSSPFSPSPSPPLAAATAPTNMDMSGVDAVDGATSSSSSTAAVAATAVSSSSSMFASGPFASPALSTFLATPAPVTAFAYPPTADHLRARSERWNATRAARISTGNTMNATEAAVIAAKVAEEVKKAKAMTASSPAVSGARSISSNNHGGGNHRSSSKKNGSKRQRDRTVIRTKVEPADDDEGNVVMVPDAADDTLIHPKSSAHFQPHGAAHPRAEWTDKESRHHSHTHTHSHSHSHSGIHSHHAPSSSPSTTHSGDDGDGSSGQSPVDEHDDDSSSDHTPAASPNSNGRHRRLGSKNGGSSGNLPSRPPAVSRSSSSSSTAAKRGQRVSCHQCKTTKSADMLLFCTSQAEKGVRKRACHKKYCDACLRRSYASWLQHANDHGSDAWQCPACTGHCTCAACQRRARKPGAPPTTTPKHLAAPASGASSSSSSSVKIEGKLNRVSSSNTLTVSAALSHASSSPPSTPSSSSTRKRSPRRSSSTMSAAVAAAHLVTTTSGGINDPHTPSPNNHGKPNSTSNSGTPSGGNGAIPAPPPMDWSAILAQQRAAQAAVNGSTTSPRVSSSSSSIHHTNPNHTHYDHDHLPPSLTIVRHDTPDRASALPMLPIPPPSPSFAASLPRVNSSGRPTSPLPSLEPHSPLSSGSSNATNGSGITPPLPTSVTTPSEFDDSNVAITVKVDNTTIDLTSSSPEHDTSTSAVVSSSSIPSSSPLSSSASASSASSASSSSGTSTATTMLMGTGIAFAPDADPASNDSIRIRPPQRRRVDEPLTALFDPPTEFDTGRMRRAVAVAPTIRTTPTRLPRPPTSGTGSGVGTATTTTSGPLFAARPPVPSWQRLPSSSAVPIAGSLATTFAPPPTSSMPTPSIVTAIPTPSSVTTPHVPFGVTMSPSAFMATAGLPNSPAFAFDLTLPASPHPILPLDATITDVSTAVATTSNSNHNDSSMTMLPPVSADMLSSLPLSSLDQPIGMVISGGSNPSSGESPLRNHGMGVSAGAARSYHSSNHYMNGLIAMEEVEDEENKQGEPRTDHRFFSLPQ